MRFGARVARIAVDSGLTCPNRDGTLSSRGCIFCDARGSGSGEASNGLDLGGQITRGMERSRRRAEKFIIYFQSFTNTYAPLARLRSMWAEALDFPDVVGLAVGTRPDCLGEDVLDLLAQYARDREVWLELGLQSASDRTLKLINRRHTAGDFARSARLARARGLKVLAHVIVGLPGEGEAEILATARFIDGLEVDGVKIHSLYVVEETELADLYSRGEYKCLTREEFVHQTVLFLENIGPRVVVHRLTGDPDLRTLVAPDWCLNKQLTLNLIRKRMDELDTWQGRCCGAPRPGRVDR